VLFRQDFAGLRPISVAHPVEGELEKPDGFLSGLVALGGLGPEVLRDREGKPDRGSSVGVLQREALGVRCNRNVGRIPFR
jgi:hypothetical protein